MIVGGSAAALDADRFIDAGAVGVLGGGFSAGIRLGDDLVAVVEEASGLDCQRTETKGTCAILWNVSPWNLVPIPPSMETIPMVNLFGIPPLSVRCAPGRSTHRVFTSALRCVLQARL